VSTSKSSATKDGAAIRGDAYPIRARMVLRVPRLWVITLVIASVMVGLITTF
jgi:hypothetical protein